ncbi:hypothetical protein JCM10213_005903 [Rhodosporidiobolus nylandii]
MASSVSPAEWAAKYAEAQTLATRATKLEVAGSYDAAFTAYLSAAQTYLFLIRNTSDAATQTRLREVSSRLVERAERIKAAKKAEVGPGKRDRLALEEQAAVLERTATIRGMRLPRWPTEVTQSPAPTSLSLRPHFSPAQLREGCRWQSASQALPGTPVFSMGLRARDIEQANVSDCSFVAALIVATEHHERFSSKLCLSSLFPQDAGGFPTTSSSGQYSVRLLLNGTFVGLALPVRLFHSELPSLAAVDDSLPVTASGKLMCADTREQRQLWPALLEKAYLGSLGSYDFGGSTMTGWLPESVSLRNSARHEELWTRVSKGFKLGHCVLTLGTRKTVNDADAAGLVPSHNYAVVDLREHHGRREVVLVNPWPAPAPTNLDSWTSALRVALDEKEDSPVLVVDWELISTYFSSLHLNWDPAVLDHSDTVHVSVAAPQAASTSSNHRHTTRLRLRVDHAFPSDVWLFLARHSADPLEKDDFIGISVSGAASGNTNLRIDDASSMTDNQYLLYRFRPESATATYDIVLSHEGSAAVFSFSLRAFSNHKVKIDEGPPPLPHSAQVHGSWSGSTAGGNHTCCTFLHNPQFCLKLSAPAKSLNMKADLDISAETRKDSPINVRLVRAGGSRVGDFEDRDILAGDSTYHYGRAALYQTGLLPGLYTVVVSSFKPLHQASFDIAVKSSLAVEVTAIPAEGAGMYSRRVEGAWEAGMDGGSEATLRNPHFPLSFSKVTSLKIRLQLPDGPKPAALFLYTADPFGAASNLIASTLPYSDPVCGVVLEVARLEPAEHGYLVVPSTFSARIRPSFRIAVHASRPIEFG